MPRLTLVFAMLSVWICPAAADEWNSRHGTCYDWDARWMVREASPNLWVGDIEFHHVGGNCMPGNGTVTWNEARAAVVGTDFFGRRVSGGVTCYLHGTVRGDEVRGFEMCSGAPQPAPFALRFSAASDEPPKGAR
jgi:hypothetical protein